MLITFHLIKCSSHIQLLLQISHDVITAYLY